MPIDPEIKKEIDAIQSAMLTLKEELGLLVKDPSAKPSDVKALREEIAKQNLEIDGLKALAKAPVKPGAAPTNAASSTLPLRFPAAGFFSGMFDE